MEKSPNNWHPLNGYDFPLEQGSEKEIPILVEIEDRLKRKVVLRSIFKYIKGQPYFFRNIVDGKDSDSSLSAWTPFTKEYHVIAWSPLDENENENDTSTL